MTAPLDVALLVPFQPGTGTFLDAPVRRSSLARINLPIREARARLEARLGRRLSDARWNGPSRVGVGDTHAHRSATAVVLGTHLERAGLSWRAIDPGVAELSDWRASLGALRRRSPRVVAVSTTYVVSAPWLRRLVALCRRELPSATLVVGGYYYATSAERFLSLPADVFCVGEGEERLAQIVAAVRDGADLGAIGGLYLRQPDGSLARTGEVEPLPIEELAVGDWELARRIEPPCDPARHGLAYVVETQRGCVFKCAYCTYRTLAELDLASVARAVDKICSVAPDGASGESVIDLVDPTGTYPKERWSAILDGLIARGGAPHPLTAYARVSDLDDAVCEKMARANVVRVLVGQESGHQGMLNRMRKGTRVAQVRPAIAALAAHGIDPVLSFIHGFEGESRETLRATRALIGSLNEGLEGVGCALYRIEPFALYDFASAADGPVPHYLAYGSTGALSTDEIMDEVVETIVQMSRIDGAPVCESLFDWMGLDLGVLKRRLTVPSERASAFRWVKTVERAAVAVLVAARDGGAPDPEALTRLDGVLGAPSRAPASLATRARGALESRFYRALARECLEEDARGPGPLTRLVLGAVTLRDTLSVKDAARALRGEEEPAAEPRVREHSERLVRLARAPRPEASRVMWDARREAGLSFGR